MWRTMRGGKGRAGLSTLHCLAQTPSGTWQGATTSRWKPFEFENPDACRNALSVALNHAGLHPPA
eukprot:CAMPEP_0115882104 /NCGR_PEP_ID=MMETSP0287-20121206/28812_1 /TAXON_ID=412157 /ORGANISM="Chrysochromulina rotalis, Strain UIO044" /LENGTH=64 /DNA_ID=CAMNT_0003338131 /DNA_START=1164 /DNA_END=1358 /DNA_ORIENTATION=+